MSWQHSWRYECKLLAPGRAAAELARALGELLPPDPHGAGGLYQVCSTYYDTARLSALHARLDGRPAVTRRVRRYGGDGAPFAEEKWDADGRSVKRRRPLDPAAPAPWGEHYAATLLVSFRRRAFEDRHVRVTLDEDVAWRDAGGAAPWRPWERGAIVEVKHRAGIGPALRALLARLPRAPLSKYALGLRHAARPELARGA